LSPYTNDVWALRNAYLDVVLNRNLKTIDDFIKAHISKPVSEEEVVKILKLLEMQRNAQLMYTSCGWFFDEIARLEPVQILKYAARVIQLISEVDHRDLEEDFLHILEKAESNEEYAVSSLFEDYSKETNIYCYTVIRDEYKKREANRLKLCIGSGTVRSNITLEAVHGFFVSLHLGIHNVIRAVHHLLQGEYAGAEKEIFQAFEAKKIPETKNFIEKYFGHENYSIQHLFRSEQQKILDEILKTTMDRIETSFKEIYEEHYPLMQIQKELPVKLPKVLATVVEFVLNREMCEQIQKEPTNLKSIQLLAWELKRWSFSRDREGMSFVTTAKINKLMVQFSKEYDDVGLLENTVALLNIFNNLKFEINLWKAQNIFFDMRLKYYLEQKKKAQAGDARSARWVSAFEHLGDFLGVSLS
ncbi:MAG: DUF3536 domain-containing protein, partial [Candidatus Omnitrophica bacterium]|nr:DUF3536 domain-containing protein [Candidatus Omnitrophota bacterium]